MLAGVDVAVTLLLAVTEEFAVGRLLELASIVWP